MAKNELPPTHPMRLALALSLSTFYDEILNEPKRADRLAKEVCFCISVFCLFLFVTYIE
jgi:hypothetical protein